MNMAKNYVLKNTWITRKQVFFFGHSRLEGEEESKTTRATSSGSA